MCANRKSGGAVTLLRPRWCRSTASIPLARLLKDLDLPADEAVIFVCRSGQRSATASEIALVAGLEKSIQSGEWYEWMDQPKLSHRFQFVMLQLKRRPICLYLKEKPHLFSGLPTKTLLAWAIAQALAREGARLAFSYRRAHGERCQDLAALIPGTKPSNAMCRTTANWTRPLLKVGETFGGKLDILIHSVAFAPKQCAG